MSFIIFVIAVLFVLWLVMALMSGGGMPGLIEIYSDMNIPYDFSVNDTLNLTGGE